MRGAGVDFIGSTTALLNYTTRSPARAFIVATESGILHQMKKASPGKTFIPAPPDNGCACNECPYMRLNTIEKVYRCMRDRTPVATLPEALRVRARVPLERMLELSR
jgi:quinolinate synthase